MHFSLLSSDSQFSCQLLQYFTPRFFTFVPLLPSFLCLFLARPFLPHPPPFLSSHLLPVFPARHQLWHPCFTLYLFLIFFLFMNLFPLLFFLDSSFNSFCVSLSSSFSLLFFLLSSNSLSPSYLIIVFITSSSISLPPSFSLHPLFFLPSHPLLPFCCQ